MNASGLLPFLWFLGIVALIPVALWLLKRTPMGGAAAAGVLRVVAQLPTAPNQRLLVVEVGQGTDAVPSVRNPITFSGTPAEYRLPPPSLDEHGPEIRRWLTASSDHPHPEQERLP